MRAAAFVLEFIFVGVDDSPWLLQFSLELLALLPPYIDRVAPVAPAVLAAVRRQLTSALSYRHLAQTSLVQAAEGFHALAATAILHLELWLVWCCLLVVAVADL